VDASGRRPQFSTPGQGNTPAGDSSTLDVADLEETEDGFKIIIYLAWPRPVRLVR
jgi:hypothetical protein